LLALRGCIAHDRSSLVYVPVAVMRIELRRICPICRARDLFVGELICPDCAEPEDHDD
jgi:hypothetical protein